MAQFGNKGGKKPTKRGGGKGGPALPVGFEIVNSRCKICTSTNRREVDNMLVWGWTQADVMRWLNAVYGEGYFTRNNVSIHKNNHLSLQDAATRKILETRAIQAGLDIENAAGFILTRVGVAETIVQTGMQHMLRGGAVPETKDVLAAMQYLDKLEGEGREVAVDEMLFEFQTFAAAVKWVLVAQLGEEKAEEWYRTIFDEFERKLEERKPKALMPQANEEPEEIEEGEYEESDGHK